MFDNSQQTLWPATELRSISLRADSRARTSLQQEPPGGVNIGLDGDRSGLWFEYARLIDELRPSYAAIENVKNLTRNGLDRVLRSLAEIGYDAEWDVLPGPFVGAPQARERVWIIAYPASERVAGLFQGIRPGEAGQGRACCEADLFDVANSAFGGDDRFPKPLLRGVDDRPANWVDRVKACGNAVIPQIATLIGNAILEARRAA